MSKERPILFNGPMVRAILEGRKTQTRRIVKGIISTEFGDCIKDLDGFPSRLDIAPQNWDVCPHGQPSDRLWVRETWAIALCGNRVSTAPEAWPEGWPIDRLRYPADGIDVGSSCKRPSIHMPRWASRILLEITNVRVERLQDISVSDCCAEGAPIYDDQQNQRHDVQTWYQELWETINGPSSWAANPLVWVIEYQVVQP